MHLQTALGMSLMFMQASSDRALAALDRSLDIAEQRGDALAQLQVLGPLHMFQLRIGHHTSALRYAKRGVAVAAKVEDPRARALAHALAGISLHFVGELSAARLELETALRHGHTLRPARTSHLGFDGETLAGVVFGRTLWLQGHQSEGLELLHRTVEEAERKNHPVTLAITLIYALSVLIPAGDLGASERHLRRFTAHAQLHALAPYLAVGLGFTGRLALLRGDAGMAVENLQSCLSQFREVRYALLATPFNMALAEGLAALHRHSEAEARIDETIAATQANGDLLYMPELLRAKAGILLSRSQADDGKAEECFQQALEWSRRQGAAAWELHTAIDYARLLASRGRADEARAVLMEAKAKFTEEPDNAHLVEAAELLASLG
jgi:hypothetical protein